MVSRPRSPRAGDAAGRDEHLVGRRRRSVVEGRSRRSSRPSRSTAVGSSAERTVDAGPRSACDDRVAGERLHVAEQPARARSASPRCRSRRTRSPSRRPTTPPPMIASLAGGVLRRSWRRGWSTARPRRGRRCRAAARSDPVQTTTACRATSAPSPSVGGRRRRGAPGRAGRARAPGRCRRPSTHSTCAVVVPVVGPSVASARAPRRRRARP